VPHPLKWLVWIVLLAVPAAGQQTKQKGTAPPTVPSVKVDPALFAVAPQTLDFGPVAEGDEVALFPPMTGG